MPFNVTKNIKLNMLRPELTVIHGKQYDNSSRIIVAQLYEDNSKWVAPAGVLGVISYIKPDGNFGFYDRTDLDEQAVTFDPNDRSIVTLILSTQALTCDGKVKIEVNFYDEGEARRLSTFAFTLDVEKSTVTQDDVTSSSEFRILAEQIGQVLEAAENLGGLTAEANTLAAGSSATAVVSGGTGGEPYKITFGIPQGIQGIQGVQGAQGVSISNFEQIAGDHSAGTLDTYRLTLSNNQYFDLQIYNGTNGQGAVSTVAGIQPIGGDVPLIIVGTTDPTTSTVGKTNQFYFNNMNGILFICTAVNGNTYTWQQAGKALDYAILPPLMDGDASTGTSENVARADHVHPTDTSRQPSNLYYENITIHIDDWVEDDTYGDYHWRAPISCEGATVDMTPTVVFYPEFALSGNYAPVANAGTDIVNVYAVSQPSTDVIVETIVVSDATAIHVSQQSLSWAEDSESWAVGTRDGEGVQPTDPAYHNNSYYYSIRASESATLASTFVGAPLVAYEASDMTDDTRVYVYVGDEENFEYGKWYYNNGSDWVVGGTYQSMVAEAASVSDILSELYGGT